MPGLVWHGGCGAGICRGEENEAGRVGERCKATTMHFCHWGRFPERGRDKDEYIQDYISLSVALSNSRCGIMEISRMRTVKRKLV